MGNLYVRGAGAIARLLIVESQRSKPPSFQEFSTTPLRSTPISAPPPLPTPTREEAGKTPAASALPRPDELTGGASKAPGTSCIPCATNHLSAGAGLLAEALRFARADGLASPEVISRLGLTQDEINSMERIDLRAEKVAHLPPGERELANHILVEVRGVRHDLENLKGADDLEKLTARMQTLRTHVGQVWWRQKLSSLPPEEKAKIMEKAQKRVEELLEVK